MATKRPDGRVEPGQRISSAFSARAWNRAQDAADVVLGARTGAMAGNATPSHHSIIVPVRLTSAPTVDYNHIGVAIKVTACSVTTAEATQAFPAGFPIAITFLSGEIAEPADLRSTTALPAPEMFALTVEPMKSGTGATTVVRCAIKGLAIARVRQFANTDRYVALPTRRSTSETVESLRGTLESSAAGYGRLVAVISSDFCLVSI